MQGFKFSGVALCIANLTEHLPLNIEIREKRYSLRKLNFLAASGGAKLHECCIKCMRFHQISHNLGRLRRTIERVQGVVPSSARVQGQAGLALPRVSGTTPQGRSPNA
jgi:hypothetical protein